MNHKLTVILKNTPNMEIVLSRENDKFSVSNYMGDMVVRITFSTKDTANEHYKALKKQYNLNDKRGRNGRHHSSTTYRGSVVYKPIKNHRID